MHDAFEMTLMAWQGCRSSSFTPTTKVASQDAGAEMMTRSRTAHRPRGGAFSGLLAREDAGGLDHHVDARGLPTAGLSGLRSESTSSTSPSTVDPVPSTALILLGTELAVHRVVLEQVGHRFPSEPRSFTATKSMSAPACLAARKKFRPMRPESVDANANCHAVRGPSAFVAPRSVLHRFTARSCVRPMPVTDRRPRRRAP